MVDETTSKGCLFMLQWPNCVGLREMTQCLIQSSVLMIIDFDNIERCDVEETPQKIT